MNFLELASNPLEAKNTAKSKQLIGCRKKNKDDIASPEIFISDVNYKLIKNIGCKEIELIKENDIFKETNFHDWFGYKRIDKIKKTLYLFLHIKFISQH